MATASARGTLALRLGCLSHELWFALQGMWEEQLKWDGEVIEFQDPDCTLGDMMQTMAGLSDLAENVQLEWFRLTCTMMSKRYYDAWDFIWNLEDTCMDDEKIGRQMRANSWRSWQRDDWDRLHTLVKAILRKEERLSVWFEIGERSATAMYELAPLKRPPLGFDLKNIYAPLLRLGLPERAAVDGMQGSGDEENALHVISQIRDAVYCFSKVLDKHEAAMIALPRWDGRMLSFRGQQTYMKTQKNSIQTIILDLFQQAAWEETVALPCDIEGDVAQAIHAINRRRIIHVSATKTTLTWAVQFKPRPR